MDPPLRALRNSHPTWTTTSPHPPASAVVAARSIVRKPRTKAIQEDRVEHSVGRIEFSISQLQAAREQIQHLKDLQPLHSAGPLSSAKQESAVEEQLQSFRTDQQKLLLREVSAQLANKVARRCIPSIATPYAARHTTLNRIKAHKGRDEAYIQQLTESFPDLDAGVEALNELVAHLVAHPERMEAEPPGTEPCVTFELLESLVLTHFDGSDALEPVQQVLACLKALSKEMEEEPFVETDCPPSAAAAHAGA